MKHKHFKHLFTVLLLLCYVSVESFAYTPLSLKGSNVKAVNNGTTVKYTDNLVVTINGIINEPQKTDITVEQNNDGTYTLSLNNFTLISGEEILPIGNIVLENIEVTEENSIKSFVVERNIIITAGDENEGDWLGPMLGEVPVNLTGKMDAEKLYFTIDIDMSEMLGQTITVVFGDDNGDDNFSNNANRVEYTDNASLTTDDEAFTIVDVKIIVEQKSDSIYKFTMSNISVGEISEIVADNVVVEEIDGVKYFTATQIRVKERYSNYTCNTLFSGKMNDEKLYLIIEFERYSYDFLITFGRYFSTGHTEYNINVPSAGQLGHLLLNEIEQWTDVESLTLSGNLNTADLAYLSRLTNLSVLDLSQTNITSMTGCKGLSRLQTVMLPSTVVTVENDAFYGCKLLNSISLPNVVSIGNSAFYGCVSLTSIDLPKAESLGVSVFSYCKNLIEANLPNVVSIGDNAFNECRSLTSIDLPKAESLGGSVFRYCENLIEANLPNVVSIGGYAFNECGNLSKVTMPKVCNISSNCFSHCYSLKNFDFPASLETIGGDAFRSCNLTEAILPEGLKRINGRAFEGCPLTVISIPSTVTVIGSGAFSTSNVTDVYCYSVAPVSTNIFSSMSQATLHVPEFSVNTYRLHDDWYSFAKIVPLEGDLEKLNINNEFAIYDYAGLTDKIDMTLSFGEKEDSYSPPSSIAKLTVNANSALSLGKYEQYQNLYNFDYDYAGDGSYIYSYPYCTTLITQNDITANSVCTHLYMRDGLWNFISFPYDVNVSDIVVPEDVLWVVRKYSGSDRAAMTGNTWQNMTDGMTLKAGEGYIFHCYYEESDEVCVSFPSASGDSGTLFAHNDVTRVLNEYPAEFAHNRSWNLIGNPYPSYFNTRDMEFNAPITVWNGNGYTAYSLLDDNYILTPNEAFFVQRPTDSNSIVFKKEGRLHYLDNLDNDEYRGSPAQRTGKSLPSRSVYNFLLENAEYSDRARLVVNEDARMDYEINCDAGKFMSSNADVPQLYINDSGVLYAINERPLGSGVIGMGAYFGKDGEYTLSLQENPNNNFSVILTDRLTGCKTDLSVDDYTFNAPAGTCNNRFTVTLENTTGIEECVEDEDSAGDIYTLDGKKVTNVDNLPAGVYLVKNGNKYVKRVITE